MVVDTKQIKEILLNDFYLVYPEKNITIDDKTGLIYSTKSIEYDRRGNFRVKFARVDGDFYCNNSELTTLEGSPQYVAGDFSCSYNPELKDFKGGPEIVGLHLNCPGIDFESLAGFPKKVGLSVVIDYHPKLPLLRLLAAKWVDFSGGSVSRYSRAPFIKPDNIREIQDVLNKFGEQGKRGFLAATSALLKLETKLKKENPLVNLRDNIKW